MIISHKYRYLFVELPRTGSSAIASELREFYDGKPILKKHSTYKDFLAKASSEQKSYFVFSCIRNPADSAVSLYYKYKTNHRGRFSDEELAKQNFFTRSLMKRQFKFVSQPKTTFRDFFMRYYRLPYDDWASLDHKNFDRVIRFESLSDDFENVLRVIGVNPVRGLPVKNQTSKDGSDFWHHYDDPAIRRRAVWVFSQYMQNCGYEFPADWNVSRSSWSSRAVLQSVNLFRNFYWRHLR